MCGLQRFAVTVVGLQAGLQAVCTVCCYCRCQPTTVSRIEVFWRLGSGSRALRGLLKSLQGPAQAPWIMRRGPSMPLGAFAGACSCRWLRLQGPYDAGGRVCSGVSMPPGSLHTASFAIQCARKRRVHLLAIVLFEAILFAFPNMARYLTTDLAPSSCCTFPPHLSPPLTSKLKQTAPPPGRGRKNQKKTEHTEASTLR